MRRSHAPRRPTRCWDSATSSTRSAVDVEVLRNVFLADGDAAALRWVSSRATRRCPGRRDGTIRVDVEDRRRIIPFTVSHPEDPTCHGLRLHLGARPRRRAAAAATDATKVQVRERRGGRARARGLRDRGLGRPVRITDAATVRASHSDGTELVVDEDTLRFRSEPGYFGPASLSFTVTDGESASDPSGRTGTIVIPIDVEPIEDQPPAFTGGVIDFEPGQAKTIDLVKLTNYPYPDAVDELAFRVLRARPEGFDVSLDGQELTIAGDRSTPTGTRRPSDRGRGRRGRRHARSHRVARGAVDAPPRAARRRPRRRGPRTHDHHRRARERPGDQPVPRHAAAGRRRARSR